MAISSTEKGTDDTYMAMNELTGAGTDHTDMAMIKLARAVIIQTWPCFRLTRALIIQIWL
jgi:hypothetical protein